MLVELAVRNLGVIESARIPFGSGLVALTGETGAGKTMLIEALNLLAGHKADPSRVRVGAEEAVVEGLFATGDHEWILRRVVPAAGRSRAYLNGELATAALLGDAASTLLEMHGQHAQQQLFSARAHRDALDEFGAIDTSDLDDLTSRCRAVRSQMERLGGDERSRARELGLLEFQVDEIDAAALRVGEDQELAKEEAVLADALGHLQAAQQALSALSEEGAAIDSLALAASVLRDRQPFTELVSRLTDLGAELADCAATVRALGESIEPDPERLDEIQVRRAALAELRRKYGDDEAAIVEFAERTRARLEELRSHDETLRRLDEELTELERSRTTEAQRIGTLRRAHAPELAARIESQLQKLAMPRAVVEIRVEDSADLPGDGAIVEFLISTNPGVAAGPLAKVASGGEMSRVMLALRLVLTQSPPTMIFDEIDAGIGGEAAIEIGRQLAEVATDQQVLVVTHLPQVAAFADMQVLVAKTGDAESVETSATVLDRQARLVELSRMISGSPDSESAKVHAEELLNRAADQRENS